MSQIRDIVNSITDFSSPPPSPSEILKAMETYPYFTSLAVAWLRRTADEGMMYDSASRDAVAKIAALASPAIGPDLQYLVSDLCNGDETDENFYPAPEEPKQPDTAETIDMFLSKYSDGSDTDKETTILEQLIFNPVADYAAVLAAEEEQSMPDEGEAAVGSNDDLLNRFIIQQKEKEAGPKKTEEDTPKLPSLPVNKPKADNPVMPPPIPDGYDVKKPVAQQEDTMLSESLAKMYIMRKNYSGAYEIINNLNLKYPEKSIYFAVQLRFLKKLILNQQLKSQERASNTIN